MGDDGIVYVSDSNHARVTAFTPEGDHLWTFGEPKGSIATSAAASTGEPELELPRGLTVQPDDTVLVVDAFRFAIMRLSKHGEVLGTYGERGVEPGQFNFANDIEVRGGFVVVADKENGRVQMLRLVD